uniref:restriction endonuclease subunit S n=1 Tax=[Lactobacillus] timonensis TaxID=1970790 RepID=UPI000C81E1D6
WEQRKLKKEYDKIGNAFVGTASPYYVKNGHFYLESNNIKDGQINHNHEVFINDNFYRKQFGKYLHTGDLVMVQSGHVGDTAVITQQYNNSAAHALIMFRKPKTPFLSDYLNNYFQSEIARNKIKVLATGNTISHILASDMSKFTVNIPNQLEQKKISKIFKTLQATINLQQRKLSLLEKIQKNFLENMLVNKPNKLPQVRFRKFTNVWTYKNLGEIATIQTGKLDANAMVPNGKYDFYTSGIKKYHIDIPAFVGPAITIAGNGATVGYMHLADGQFNAYQRTYVLSKLLANRIFIFYEVGHKLPRKIQQESRTGNIPYIVMGMLTELQLIIPDSNEQEKVGNLFENLNKLIEDQQVKLRQLSKIKKFFLQQMFI